jgi:cytosine/adenosine deaminase-related metal-dependent hydrolase
VVSVSDAGEIVDISTPEHLDREAGVEFFAGIIVPGFFNAHCHLELSHLRGTIPEGGGFEAFVRGMKAAPRGGGEKAAALWDARMWAEGVSAVADICNGDSTDEIKRRSSIRYHSFREIFGAGATVPEGVENLTPHSLYSLDGKTFRQIVERSTGLLSIHFMESDYEVADPAERLVELVPADRPVMLVHNCLTTQCEIDIIMSHFTAPVTWVVCPASNRYISRLVPPIELLRRNGLRIAVGTDSLASNETLSVVRELSLIEGVPLAELFGWASVDTIEVGHTPGLVLIEGVDFEKMTLTPQAKSRRII